MTQGDTIGVLAATISRFAPRLMRGANAIYVVDARSMRNARSVSETRMSPTSTPLHTVGAQ